MLLDQIKGQDPAIAIVRNALTRDRLAHAYLFTGPAGVGKRCTAVGLAKALLCQDVPQVGCESCPACLSVIAGTHPDYSFSTTPPDKQSLGIDQVRGVQQFLTLRAVRGGKKVAILDDAHVLTAQAQSALLKVLEEPPGDAVLLLLAVSAATLSIPLLSRCQQVRFAFLPVEEVEAILRSLRSEYDKDPDTARLLSRYSRGSIGQALTLDPQLLVEERQQIVEHFSTLRGASFSTLSQLAEWLVADRSAKAKKQPGGTERLERGARLELVLAWYEEALRYLLLGRNAVVRYQDCLSALAQTTHGASVPQALHDLRLVYDTIQALGRNANPRLTVEDMLLQLAAPVSGR